MLSQLLHLNSNIVNLIITNPEHTWAGILNECNPRGDYAAELFRECVENTCWKTDRVARSLIDGLRETLQSKKRNRSLSNSAQAVYTAAENEYEKQRTLPDRNVAVVSREERNDIEEALRRSRVSPSQAVTTSSTSSFSSSSISSSLPSTHTSSPTSSSSSSSQPAISSPLPRPSAPPLQSDTDDVVIVAENQPLVSSLTTIAHLIENRGAGPIRDGLALLHPILMMHKIRGDGHCLFRSIATFLVKDYRNMTADRRQAYLNELDISMQNLRASEALVIKFPRLAKLYGRFKQILRSAVETGQTADAVIRTASTSDDLVAFLRQVTCAYNFRYPNDAFTQDLQADGISTDAYFERMAGMERKEYGGHAEIIATAYFFQKNIRIYTASVIGRAGNIEEGMRSFKPKRDQGDELFLIYTPNHYDLGVPRAGEVQPVAASSGPSHIETVD